MSAPRLVSLRACELAGGRRQESRVIGWRFEDSSFSSEALRLASQQSPHLVLDESTNWFPSASLKMAAVPQCSVFGGIANSTPFAESSS